MALPKEMSLGTKAISAEKVVLPTEEHIHELTLKMTRSDQKWCQFPFKTTKRAVINIDPSFAQFVPLCAAWKAMLATPEGVAVLALYDAVLDERPLELKVQLEEVESVPPE